MTRIQKTVLWSVAVCVCGFIGALFLIANARDAAMAQNADFSGPVGIATVSERPTKFVSERNSPNDLLMILHRETGLGVESTNDEEKLLGTWKVVSGQDNGEPRLPDDRKLIFDKTTVTMKVGDKTESEASYVLNLNHKPHWIDLTISGKKMLGIFELKGEELRICLNEGASPRNSGVAKIADVKIADVAAPPAHSKPSASAGRMLPITANFEPSPSAFFQQQIDAAVETLRVAQSDEEKRVAKDALRKALSDLFTQDMHVREVQAREIETRLAKLRQQYQAREKAKDEIIDLQLQVLEKNAAGLGFPGVSASSRTSDFDLPMSGIPSQPGQNTPGVGGEDESLRMTHPPTLQQLKDKEPGSRFIEHLTRDGHFVESPDGKLFAWVNKFFPNGPSGACEIRVSESATGRLVAAAKFASPVGMLKFTDEGVCTPEDGGVLKLLVPLPKVTGSAGNEGQRLDVPDSPASDSPAPQAVESKTAHSIPTQMHHFTSGADVKSIAYSADGDRIAIANGSPTRILQTDGSSRVQDDWKPSVEILNAETGKTIVSLKLSNETEDAVLAATERVSHFEVTALTFSPDGDLLAVGTSIGQVKLFNARIGELVQTLDDEQSRLADKETPENWKSLQRAIGTVASLAFSPDSSQLAMCGQSFSDFSDVFDGIERSGRLVTGPGRLKVWRVEPRSSKYDLAYDLAGHSQANAVAFSSLGNLLASAGRWESGHDNGTGVIIWNPVTGEKIRTIMTEGNGDTHAVAFSPYDQSIAIGSVSFDKDKDRDAATGTVTLTRVGSGIVVWRSSFSGWVKPLAFSPNGDGESVVVLCGGQSLRLLDTETGTVTHEIRATDSSPGERWNDFATAPQRHMLAVGGIDAEKRGFVTTWDMGQRSRRQRRP